MGPYASLCGPPLWRHSILSTNSFPSFGRRFRWSLEYWAARTVLGAFALLSIDGASAVGGWLLRAVGPFTRAHQVAWRNLRRIYPDMSANRINQILRGMWDNLGRTMGELPHLEDIAAPDSGRVTIIGGERVSALKSDGLPGILFSAHMANWELGVRVCARHIGLPLYPLFRAPNNPLLADLYGSLRTEGSAGEALPKGRFGAKRALSLLKQGAHLAMLVDQKMNDGLELSFMGHPAMTAPAMASFALKFALPVLPVQVVRTHGAHFALYIEAPLTPPATDDREQNSVAMMQTVNDIIGRWVNDHPEQWLWVHRRWKA